MSAPDVRAGLRARRPRTRPRPVPAAAVRQAGLTSALVATVVFLTAIAPLATDMYVPAFPAVAADLSATATQVQLTLTTFFVGMAPRAARSADRSRTSAAGVGR